MKLPPGHVAGQGVVRPTGYGGFGERMLRGMGWDKGQGLGRTGDGIKEAIQVKKKEDTVGVRRPPARPPAARPAPLCTALCQLPQPAALSECWASRRHPMHAGGRQHQLRLAGQVVGAGL